MTEEIIPLVDLARNYQTIKGKINKTLKKVFQSGRFILGENVAAFEQEFASYLGVKYAVGVASGTDALMLSLRALGLGKDDEVIVPANAYPTAFAVWAAGAKIKLVDINPATFNLDVSQLEKAVGSATRAVVPVHLYGQPADMQGLLACAKKHELFVIEDACQAHGAFYHRKKVGTFGNLGCFSFYPTKNLGCFGDGGMVVTNNKNLAQKIRRLRMYGEKRRYQSEVKATHSRLDELQAAILRLKLQELDLWNKKRRQIAQWYFAELKNTDFVLPKERLSQSHVYHLFVIRAKRRDKLQDFLYKNKVETGVHYPKPVHQVKAFASLGYRLGDFPEAEKAAREVLSLPCYPELTRRQIKRICNLIENFLK